MRWGLVLLMGCAVSAGAQQEFQVATIKPSAADEVRTTQIRGSRFATTGTTLQDLLLYAYNVHPSQIVGGPEWMRTAKFDVMADPETETRPASDVMKAMVGRLLGERFHLVLRREQRELPVYGMVRTARAAGFLKADGERADIPSGGFEPPGYLAVRNGTMVNFIGFLQRFCAGEINRPVVDQTGVPGKFDFDLHYTPINAGAAEEKEFPGLFTAMQEQLGLKLEATRAPVEVLVVESVTQPSAN